MDSVDLLLVLLVAAFISLWIPERHPRQVFAYGLLGSAAFPAIALGALSFTGLLWVALLFLAGRYYHHHLVVSRQIARLLLLGLVLGLGFGLLPGFDALTLYDSQVLKTGSAEYGLRIRPDKVLAGFTLLAVAVPLTRNLGDWRHIILVTLPVLAVTAPVVMLAGWLLGHVDFQPHIPNALFVTVWAVTNLLFVAGVEEGFFRGVIQHGLLPRLGTAGAVGAAAVLFGLAHFGGGLPYVLLATLAGLGYGAAYHFSGQRIEAAMLTHFGLNFLHLWLFSYPYAVN